MNQSLWHLDFPQEYLHSALFVSLLSVWVLVGLFVYLNFYTKRQYFTIWTAAWLFYALWLTLGLRMDGVLATNWMALIRQSCVAVSAVFLMWGSARFLSLPIRQSSLGLFMSFLLVWTFVSPHLVSDQFQAQMPVFILIGLGSVFAAVCFYRLRRQMPFVGAGMLGLGFSLWGVFLGTYPILQKYPGLTDAGFLMAALLQLFIAVSMIVLVLEEVRYHAEKVRLEIETIRSEKEALQAKILTAEEQCRSLYDQARLSEGVQRAYEELRRTQQVVVRQERLRALGEMASGVAHDINNALSPIMGYSEMLLTLRSDMPEDARRYLTIVRQSGADIAHIVTRMREFYRRDSDDSQFVKIDVRQLLDEVIELTRPRWRDISQREAIFIQVVNESESKLPQLLCNPSELREALINLVFNSVDAMPQGGKITLAARFHAEAGQGAPDDEPMLVVEVRDTGTGMDEKTRARCLEPFFSTKAKHGTGLGLPMVYGVVQRHGGSIEVESAPGRGTCVRLTMPLRDEQPRPRTTPGLNGTRKRSLRLLFIDDEEHIRDMVQACLTELGHRVTTAPNGGRGLAAFREALAGPQPFEAVITDLGMAEMDGRQLARQIKKESGKTPVIMMTGWGAMMKEDGETPVGVDALIGKPARISELNELLLRVTNPRNAAAI